MIWPPLVSGRAFRLLEADHARVVEQCGELIGQLVRLARRANGMSETPAERKRERVEIPAKVWAEINAYESPQVRAMRKDTVLRTWRETQSWDEALAAIKEEG